jgi:serine/threonine protein kinase
MNPEFLDSRQSSLQIYLNTLADLVPTPVALEEFLKSDPEDLENAAIDATKHKPCIDDFKLLKIIGKGSFGKVMLAQHITLAQVYAIKVISKKSVRQQVEAKHVMAGNTFEDILTLD